MFRYRPAYPPEFRRRMVDLVRSGRTPEEPSREFGPSAASIAGWVCRADAGDGTRPDVMTTAEREELARLRRDNRQRPGAPASGFYAWRDRRPSDRQRSDTRAGAARALARWAVLARRDGLSVRRGSSSL